MALPQRCAASSAPLRLAAGRRLRRHTSVAAALALALGCVICAPSALAQSQPALSGKWQLSCTSRGGETRQISLTIGQHGAALSGSYGGGRRSGQLSGSVQGNEVSLELAGKRRSATLTGTTDGNTMQVHSANGASCKGTRQ